MTNLNTDKLIALLQDIGQAQKDKRCRDLLIFGVGALIAHRELCAKLIYHNGHRGTPICEIVPWSEVKDKQFWYDAVEDAASDLFHDSQSTAE